MAGALFLGSSLLPAQAEETRTLVELPSMMEQHMLGNMRAHLEVINQLLGLMAEGNLDAASDLAEQELGMSSLDKHGASHIAGFYPEGMQQAGTAMHRAASRYSRVAEEGDTAGAYKALGEITAACVACHAGYRVR
jgi:hypothetical protein